LNRPDVRFCLTSTADGNNNLSSGQPRTVRLTANAEFLNRELAAYREINCPQHVNAVGKLLTKLDDAYGW
jgi:hypothetical protein